MAEVRAAPAAPSLPHRARRLRASLRAWATDARRAALRDVWRALWLSRALVWVAGLVGVLAVGRDSGWRAFDPNGYTVPFGGVGDALVSPAARWDSVWYLSIASDAYADDTRAAFFPLYPLLVRVLGAPLALVAGIDRADLIAGIALSLVAFVVALYVVHRLAELELGAAAARRTVLLVALFPTAFAFSAVYSESLFLALSAGAIYSARLGRWRTAGLLGALAAATRSTGVLLLVPLALLYAYGPRSDAAPMPTPRRRWSPRYPLRRDLGWLLAVPAGLAAYLAYIGAATGDALAPFHVQELWYHRFAGPLGGIWDGTVAAWDGIRQLASGSRERVYWTAAGGDPFDVAANNLRNFGFLLFGVVALVGVLRRLPVAYGAWVLAALALPLTYPVGPEPLASIPRYMAVLFPLHMWLAKWSLGRRLEPGVALASAALLALFTAQFAAWKWVA